MKNIVISIFFVLVPFLSQAQQPTLSLFDLPVQDATNYADAYDYWFPDNDTVTVMPVYLFDLENYLHDVDSFSFSVIYNPNEIQPVLDVINTVNTQSFITSVGYVLPIIQLAMVYGDTVMPDNLIYTSINTISNNVEELSVSCTFYNDSTFYADSEGCLIYLPFKILNRCGDANYNIEFSNDVELFTRCRENNYSLETNSGSVLERVEFPVDSSLQITGDISVSVTCKSVDMGEWSTILVVMADDPSAGEQETHNILYSLDVDPSGNLVYYHEYNGGVNTPEYSSNIYIADNIWKTITITRDVSLKKIKFYENGVLVDSLSYNNNPNGGGSSELSIGARPGTQWLGITGAYNPFSGFLDNVSIFDYLLDDNEVQMYANCPPTGTESSLVGYWNFEEGNGNVVYDQTNNGNNGIINGANYSADVLLGVNSYSSFVSTQDSTLSIVDGSIVLSSIEVSVNEFMGNLEAIVDNNFGNLIYTWSTGETDPYITPSPNVDSYWVSVCDEEGCCDTSDVYSLSLNNVVSKTEITLYPNPSKGDFLLSFNNNKNIKTKIDIISLNGSLVSSYETKECFFLMENNELKGIYFLRVFNKEIDAITKLIIID